MAEVQLQRVNEVRHETCTRYYEKAVGLWCGTGEAFDRKLCLEYFEKAAELHHPIAPIWLTLYWSDHSQGHTIDGKNSKRWERVVFQNEYIKVLQEEADKKIVSSAFLLGYLYQEGCIVAKDVEKARHYYLIGAEQNYAPALNNLGTLCLVGRVNREESHYYSKIAADLGYPPAQYNIGLEYYERFVDMEEDELSQTELLDNSLSWLIKAAQQNYPNAQTLLAKVYLHHKSSEPGTRKEGIMWLKKAAESGFVSARYLLAHCYKTGTGVQQNHDKAFHWFQSCSEEYGPATGQSGWYYISGEAESVPKDYYKGYKLLCLSADNGAYVGMYYLGSLLGRLFWNDASEIPNTIPHDDSVAMYWLLQASYEDSSLFDTFMFRLRNVDRYIFLIKCGALFHDEMWRPATKESLKQYCSDNVNTIFPLLLCTPYGRVSNNIISTLFDYFDEESLALLKQKFLNRILTDVRKINSPEALIQQFRSTTESKLSFPYCFPPKVSSKEMSLFVLSLFFSKCNPVVSPIIPEAPSGPFDIKLITNDSTKPIGAHKSFLNDSSKFFQSLFANSMRESTEGVIHLGESFEVFDKLVNLLYLPTIEDIEQSVRNELDLELLEVCHRRGFDYIHSIILSTHLTSSITMSEYNVLMDHASHFNDNKLKEALLNCGARNIRSLYKSAKEPDAPRLLDIFRTLIAGLDTAN